MATLTLAIDPTPANQGARIVKNDLDDIKRKASQAEDATDDFGASAGRSLTTAAGGAELASAAYDHLGRSVGQVRMMQRQLSFQLVDIGQALVTAPTMGIYALQNLGFQVAQIGQLYMGQGGFNQAVKDSARQLGTFTARLGLLAPAVAVVGIAFAGMRHEIDKTTAYSVSFGDVFKATMKVAASSITTAFSEQFAALRSMASAVWGFLIDGFKLVGNSIVQLVMFNIEIAETGIRMLTEGLSAGDGLMGRLTEIANTDYMGGLYRQIRNVAVGLATARAEAGKFKDVMSDAWFGLREAAEYATSAEFDAIKAWEVAREKSLELMERQRVAAEQLGAQFGNLFTSVVQGSISAREAFARLIEDMARAMAQKAFTNIFMTLMGVPTAGGGMGGGFGGFMASGGPVAGNTPYIVGEKGPELFVPSSSGQIVPNNQMGGMGGITFAPVTNIDARGAAPGVGDDIERRMNAVLDNFSRFKLPARVKQIQGDPYASGY